MTAEIQDLPRVTPDHARLSQLLASRQTLFQVAMADAPCQLELSPSQHDFTPDFLLQLDVGGQPLAIGLDNQAVSLLLPGQLDHQAVAGLPHDLLMAALHHGLAASLQQLSHDLRRSVAMSGLIPAEEAMASGLTLTVDSQGQLGVARVPFCETLWEIIRQLPRQQPEAVPNIPVQVSLELGRAVLSPEELQGLESGDIVFLQKHVSDQQLIIRVNARTAFLAVTEDCQATILQRIAPMDDEQDYPDSHDAESLTEDEAQDGVNLSDIAIELLFEVGRQQLTVQELAALQPGHVFDLERPMEQPVRIRVNGRVIAECQLVQIDNRLGARISRLVDK